MVNIFSLERSSQESRGFSHERFKNKDGERFYPDDNLVAQFTSSDDPHVMIDSNTDANPMEVSAGSYSGQVYFSIVCE